MRIVGKKYRIINILGPILGLKQKCDSRTLHRTLLRETIFRTIRVNDNTEDEEEEVGVVRGDVNVRVPYALGLEGIMYASIPATGATGFGGVRTPAAHIR